MKDNKLLTAENGQAIMLIALMLVVLLGFTGLAIDGGSLYFTQRDTRNAADAAILSAVYALCKGGDVATAGLEAAAANGFDNNGATNTVAVNNPPTAGPATGNSEYVEVEIWADAPTYLIQVVYTGPTEVTSRAVGRCRAPGPAFPDIGLLALNDDPASDCPYDGILFSGTGNTTVYGAGVHSNSPVCPASTSCAAISGQGSGDIEVPDDQITSVGCINNSNGNIENYAEGQDPIEDPLASIDPPNDACSEPIQTAPSSGSMNPGHYSLLKPNSPVTLNPGIYCFEDAPNVIDLSSSSITGNGVVLYIKAGDVAITGSANHDLRAPTDSNCSEGLGTCEWRGMLMWVDANNTAGQQDIRFGGGAGSYYQGTIYAPSHDCFIAGNNYTQALQTQFICDTIEVTGTGDVTITYTAPYLYDIPPVLTFNE